MSKWWFRSARELGPPEARSYGEAEEAPYKEYKSKNLKLGRKESPFLTSESIVLSSRTPRIGLLLL